MSFVNWWRKGTSKLLKKLDSVVYNAIMRSIGDAFRSPKPESRIMVGAKAAYALAIQDLRNLLRKLGRHEFKAYGYAKQLRAYRARVN